MIPYKNTFYEKNRNNKYSTHGEDGVLEEMLKRLDIQKGWCCEVGIGKESGKTGSNVFYQTQQNGMKTILIEADKTLYEKMTTNTVPEYPNITPINTRVNHATDKKENCLDHVLERTDITKDFEILSLNTGEYDYQIWKHCKEYQPKLVVVNVNSDVNTNNNNHVHEPGKYVGTGFRPLYNLGRFKEYNFVLHTGKNMIFARGDLKERLGLPTFDSLSSATANFCRK